MNTMEETMAKVASYKEFADAVKAKQDAERKLLIAGVKAKIDAITPRAMNLMDMARTLQQAGDKGIEQYFNHNRGTYFGRYDGTPFWGVIYSDRPYMGCKGNVFAIVRQKTGLGDYCTYNRYDYIKDAYVFLEKYETFEKEVLDYINGAVDKVLNKRYSVEYHGVTEVVAENPVQAMKKAVELGYDKQSILKVTPIE